VLKIEDLYLRILAFSRSPLFCEREMPLDIADFQHVDLYQLSHFT
jgi:hypothetical protein